MGSGLRMANLDKTINKTLMPCQSSVEFASGELLFVHDSILMARPLDHRLGEFTAPARPIMDGIHSLSAAHLSVISASSSGVMAYSSGVTGDGGFQSSQLYILDPDGSHEKPLEEPLMTFGFDLSSDGKYLTLSLPESKNGTFDIWVLDIERNLRTRFTFGPESESKGIWDPDNEWITYSSDQSGRSTLFRKKASGTGDEEALFDSSTDVIAQDWSSDGNLLSYTETDSTGKFILGIFNLATKETNAFHGQVEYSEGGGCFSPDDKWMAYASTETGNPEIFVESLEPGKGRWRVSADGGYNPKWAPDGNKLYYQAPGGLILAVEVESNVNGGLHFGATTQITDRVEGSLVGSFAVNQATGQLIVKRSTQSRKNSTLCLVNNWQQLLPPEK